MISSIPILYKWFRQLYRLSNYSYFNDNLFLLLDGFKHSYMKLTILKQIHLTNNCVWKIDGTLTGTTTPGKNGSRRINNEWVLLTAQTSWTIALPLDAF